MRFKVIQYKPDYFSQRNVWKFAWLPRKVKLWDPTTTYDERIEEEYWIWLERYHCHESYSNRSEEHTSELQSH